MTNKFGRLKETTQILEKYYQDVMREIEEMKAKKEQYRLQDKYKDRNSVIIELYRAIQNICPDKPRFQISTYIAENCLRNIKKTWVMTPHSVDSIIQRYS